jgi:hypothetical protein
MYYIPVSLRSNLTVNTNYYQENKFGVHLVKVQTNATNPKPFNLDAHVWVFKAIIKDKGEIINEEVFNLFNFTLKDNTSN